MSSIKEESIIFFMKLNHYLNHGWPILEVFKRIEEDMSNAEFKNVILQIHQSIEEGNYFSDSFDKFPNIFDKKIIAFIKTGEETGQLFPAFNMLPELILKEICIM